jgi:tetratricopeptide (TPR) repeat protein
LRSAANDFYRLKDYDRVLALAEESVVLAPNAYRSYTYRAFIRRYLGDREGEREDLNAAWAVPLDTPGSHYARAGTWRSHGMVERALEDYGRAIQLAPGWADPYRLRGYLFMQEKRYEEALRDIDRAAELAPRWVEPYFSRGLILNAVERFEEALAAFGRSAELGAKGKNLRWEQAQALARLGREDEALATLDQAIELWPHLESVHRRKGYLLFNLGRVEEAVAQLDRAVEAQPSNSVPYAVRGRMRLFQPGRCREAMTDLDRAREIDPTNYWVGSQFAWVQAALLPGLCPSEHDPGLALEPARRAVDFDPRNADYRTTLGVALYRAGSYEEARDALMAAQDLRAQEHPGDSFFLAMTHVRLGDNKKARVCYDQAVVRMNATYPGNPEYRFFREEAARLLGIEP